MTAPIRSMPGEWDFLIQRHVDGTNVCYHVSLKDTDGQLLIMQFYDLESFVKYFERKVGSYDGAN